MGRLNFEMINEEIIRRKQTGVPIKQSAVDMGFSLATYYRWAKRNYESTWMDVKDDERVFVGGPKLKKSLEETHETKDSVKQTLPKRRVTFSTDSDESTDTKTTVITRKPKKKTPIRNLRQRQTPLKKGMSGGGLTSNSATEDDSTETSDTLKGIALAIKQSQDNVKKYRSKYINE